LKVIQETAYRRQNVRPPVDFAYLLSPVFCLLYSLSCTLFITGSAI
jgi:hypothetical protein